MEWKTDETELRHGKSRSGEMKRVAEEEPIVLAVEVAHPVQVRLALRVVPPDIACLPIVLKGLYGASPISPPFEYSRG